MKRAFLLTAIAFFILTGCGYAQYLPQLKPGVPVHYTLTDITITLKGDCDTHAEYSYAINPDVIPVAEGVYIKLLVSEMNVAANAVTNDNGDTIHVNDEIPLTASPNFVSFHSTAAGNIKLKLVVAGTPTVNAEKYYCYLTFFGTGNCPFYGIWSGSDSTCAVGALTGVDEAAGTALNVYYNHVSNAVHINLPSPPAGPVTLQLFNLLGQEVASHIFNVTSPILNLSGKNTGAGLYIWKITAGNNILNTGKLCITR